MAVLETEAIVLHMFDYLESSRILRIVTRDGGVRSVLAKGVRRSSRRFGSALDLFAQGYAQLHTKPGRDLDTLSGFDVVQSRPLLAADLQRFTGASAISELIMRFGREAPESELFDTVREALDTIAFATGSEAAIATLASAWRVVAELGFAPTLDSCAECHVALDPVGVVLFSHSAGGALCTRCGRLSPSGRVLPAAARAAIRSVLAREEMPALDDAALRAHQRLLREFLAEHLADGRPLRAMELWEEQRW